MKFKKYFFLEEFSIIAIGFLKPRRRWCVINKTPE